MSWGTTTLALICGAIVIYSIYSIISFYTFPETGGSHYVGAVPPSPGLTLSAQESRTLDDMTNTA